MSIKITSLKVHVIQSHLETPFSFSQGWVNKRSATLVEINTNDGITGWGEAFCQGLEPPEISAAVIENSLKELIINENPLDIEKIWFKMYNQTRDFGRIGSVISGISAIDIALWDIAGKYYEKPIYQLLGGLLYKKPMMKQFFGSQFFLTEQTWFLLSLRWGLFFGFLTIANEIIWRNYSTEEWVFVKVFILFPLVGIFMLAQLPLTLRGRVKRD